jgi:hypothetical protein
LIYADMSEIDDDKGQLKIPPGASVKVRSSLPFLHLLCVPLCVSARSRVLTTNPFCRPIGRKERKQRKIEWTTPCSHDGN